MFADQMLYYKDTENYQSDVPDPAKYTDEEMYKINDEYGSEVNNFVITAINRQYFICFIFCFHRVFCK